jgi:hypothetical protein
VLAIDGIMLVLRFFHIVAGVLWVGSAFLFVGFIGPSAAEVGPAAMPLLTVAVKKRRVVQVITILGFTTVIAGWLMWLKDLRDYENWSVGNWVLDNHFGLALTIGAIFATAAAFEGYFGVGRNVERLVDMGGAIQASGGAPTPDQQSDMERVGKRIEHHGKRDLVLLLLAVTLMSTARYWV